MECIPHSFPLWFRKLPLYPKQSMTYITVYQGKHVCPYKIFSCLSVRSSTLIRLCLLNQNPTHFICEVRVRSTDLFPQRSTSWQQPALHPCQGKEANCDRYLGIGLDCRLRIALLHPQSGLYCWLCAYTFLSHSYRGLWVVLVIHHHGNPLFTSPKIKWLVRIADMIYHIDVHYELADYYLHVDYLDWSKW